jgi:hypothetical protein
VADGPIGLQLLGSGKKTKLQELGQDLGRLEQENGKIRVCLGSGNGMNALAGGRDREQQRR